MRLLVVLITFTLVIMGCRDDQPRTTSTPTEIEFRNDGTLTFFRADSTEIITIDIEIAETEQAITQGLMGRERLPRNSGMLFLMPQTRIQSFWMKNTPLSLDITFISEDQVVVNTARNTRPYAEESYVSNAPARFVLETQAGFVDMYGITAGDFITWSRGN